MSMKAYLEKDVGLTSADRRDVLKCAGRTANKSLKAFSRDSLLILGVILLAGPVFGVVHVLVHISGINIPRVFINAIAGGIAGGFGAAFMARRMKPFVYAELRARGHNVCPKCGYLRTGLEDTAPCPDCGVSIEVPR
ncbi:MAG: hypothetical protein AB8F26_04300 [Phycisphaerales bacterium]